MFDISTCAQGVSSTYVLIIIHVVLLDFYIFASAQFPVSYYNFKKFVIISFFNGPVGDIASNDTYSLP